MRPRGLRRLDLHLINQEKSLCFKDSDTTYRQDGCTIGQDYMRIDGTTINRGTLKAQNVTVDTSDVLGRGAFSTVRRGSWNHNGQSTTVAIKECEIIGSTQSRRQMMLKELRMLSKDRSDCITQLHGAFLKKDSVIMVMELMDRGSLQALIYHNILPETVVTAISYQIIEAMCFLHKKRRLHRDLKPANVLVNSSGQVKLCDLGMASMGDQSLSTTVLGTRAASSASLWSPK
jgi:serine/threonine protein kinase